jgi:hypothetical protein
MGVGPQERPDRAAVRQLLLDVVRNDAGHELFTANSLLDLLALVDEAAQTVAAEGDLGSARLEDARRAVRVLLSTLADVRDETGESAFRETTIAEARLRLCPGFWPFC